MAASHAVNPSTIDSQDATNDMPLGSMRAGIRLHRDFQKRVSRQQQRCAAASAAEEATLKAKLSWHAPRPGVSTETIVQRLYQTALDKQAQKAKRLHLEAQRQAKLQEEQLRRQQQQRRPGMTERLYQDHKRRSEALEKKRQEQEDAQAEWLRMRSVHRRGGDAGVFTKASSPKSSLPSTPSTTAPSTPPRSPPGSPGRRGHGDVPRISRAVALAQAAALLRDAQKARASPEELEAHLGKLPLPEEAKLLSSAEAASMATPVADQLEGPTVQQVAESCQAAAADSVADSESRSMAERVERVEDEPKLFLALDSESDEEIEVEEREGQLEAEAEEDADEEESEDESEEESDNESEEESDMEAW